MPLQEAKIQGDKPTSARRPSPEGYLEGLAMVREEVVAERKSAM